MPTLRRRTKMRCSPLSPCSLCQMSPWIIWIMRPWPFLWRKTAPIWMIDRSYLWNESIRLDLFSDGGGVYYEAGFNDVKNWYEVGEATLRVSDELEFKNNIYPEKGEQIFYAGSFLVGEVTNYNFTPHNTTIRTENGQIVFMERIYTP